MFCYSITVFVLKIKGNVCLSNMTIFTLFDVLY